ncbi:MAG: hypothetical protein C0170_02395, partial [Hydrogenobaculum sp.]
MLRVLLISHGSIFGGAEKNFIKLFELLKEENLDISFLVRNEMLHKKLLEKGAKSYYFGMNNINRFETFSQYKKNVEAIKHKVNEINPDILV